MRILALAAAVSLSVAPTMTMAQGPANAVLQNGVWVCADGFTLGPGGACVSAQPDAIVAVDPGAAPEGLFGNIPPAALGVGALALAAGGLIGLAAALDDDDANGTTTTPSTPGT